MSKIEIINKEQILPESYSPTNHIVFCSNKITNYKYLISDNGFIPILIGQGEIPRIWLFAKTPQKEVITLVDDTVSNLDPIKIDVFSSEKRIEIKDIQNGITILKLSYQQNIIVNQIDLGPLGYEIVGDSSKLMVGGVSIKGNTISGVNAVIGFGDKKENKNANLRLRSPSS